MAWRVFLNHLATSDLSLRWCVSSLEDFSGTMTLPAVRLRDDGVRFEMIGRTASRALIRAEHSSPRKSFRSFNVSSDFYASGLSSVGEASGRKSFRNSIDISESSDPTSSSVGSCNIVIYIR